MNRREAALEVLPWRTHTTIRSVPADLVAAGNRLLSGQRTFVVADDDGGERLASVVMAEVPAGGIVALRLADGVIHVDAAVAVKPDDRPDWRDYPDPGSRQLAWSVAANQALVLIQRVFRSPVDVVDIHAEASVAGPAFWVRMTVAAPDADAPAGSVQVPPLTLGLGRAFVARLAQLPRRRESTVLSQRLQRWSQIEGRLRVQVPGPSLTPAQLRGLAYNDVIVLGGRRVIETGAARLLLDGSRPGVLAWSIKLVDGVRAQVTGTAVAVQSRNTQENPVAKEASSSPEGASAPEGETTPLPNPVERLPVQVEFDLGRMDLPLAELAQIEPGYVFPLPQALEHARVAIRLNGTVAGTGELVAIGDVLGVRLTAWTHGPDID